MTMVPVRSRLQALVYQRDDRHATAGCLLSVLLILPLFTQHHDPLLLLAIALIYSGLVVPLVLSYIPPGLFLVWLLRTTQSFCNNVGQLATRITTLFANVFHLLVEAHLLFLQLDPIHTLTNQIVFFMLAEKFLCPEKRFSSLYSLFLFSVVAYLRKSLKERHWAQYLNVTDAHDFIQLTSTFVILKLGKAVVMTVVLMMLTIQFNQYDPSIPYLLLTGTYFLLQDRTFETCICNLLQGIYLDFFEGLESLWTPILLRSLAVVLSSLLIVPVIGRHAILCSIAAYTNVYVCYQDLTTHSIRALRSEQATVARFPLASPRQLSRDDTCAICLDRMTLGRVTPCRHLFHGQCLRLCLRESSQCPLCKRDVM